MLGSESHCRPGANSYTLRPGAEFRYGGFAQRIPAIPVGGPRSAGCSGSAVKCVTVNPQGPVLNILGLTVFVWALRLCFISPVAQQSVMHPAARWTKLSFHCSKPGASTHVALIGSNASVVASSAVKRTSVTSGFAINVSGVTSTLQRRKAPPWVPAEL